MIFFSSCIHWLTACGCRSSARPTPQNEIYLTRFTIICFRFFLFSVTNTFWLFDIISSSCLSLYITQIGATRVYIYIYMKTRHNSHIWEWIKYRIMIGITIWFTLYETTIFSLPQFEVIKFCFFCLLVPATIDKFWID